jgi:hypothetical protein
MLSIVGQVILKAVGDLIVGAKQQHTSAQKDDVAEAEDAKLAILTIHSSSIGALEIGKDKVVIVLLDLAMESTDSLVVELNGVPFLATDCDWWPKI